MKKQRLQNVSIKGWLVVRGKIITFPDLFSYRRAPLCFDLWVSPPFQATCASKSIWRINWVHSDGNQKWYHHNQREWKHVEIEWRKGEPWNHHFVGHLWTFSVFPRSVGQASPQAAEFGPLRFGAWASESPHLFLNICQKLVSRTIQNESKYVRVKLFKRHT